jgi:hypothetical protein
MSAPTGDEIQAGYDRYEAWQERKRERGEQARHDADVFYAECYEELLRREERGR